MKNLNKWFVGAILLYLVLIVPTMGMPALEDLASAAIYGFFLILCLATIISSIFVHELGHFFFGKMTGYKFESFRAWTFSAYKDVNGKIQSDSNVNADTGGQCLMRPPKREDFKFFWYVAGGIIFNLITALILLMFYLFIKDLNVNVPTFNEYLIRSLMKLSIITGLVLNVYMILINWLPLKNTMNDGYLYRRYKKNENTKEAIYLYLLINSDLNRGQSLKHYDLSTVTQTVDKLEDKVQLLLGTYIYEQLMLQHKFNEAYIYMNKYIGAVSKEYRKEVPPLIYLHYYLISLLYFEEASMLPFTKDHQKVLDQHAQELPLAFLTLVKHYYEHDEEVDEKVYEDFLKVCRKQAQQTVVAEYLSLFAKIVSSEQSYRIIEVDLETVWRIRHEVMWPEKDFDYIKLEEDEKGVHLGLVVDDQVVSVVSVFENNKDVQFRKFATLHDYQNQGYGSRLLNYMLMLLSDKELNRIWCNARVEKSGFYERFGLEMSKTRFHKEGKEYVIMEKRHQD